MTTSVYLVDEDLNVEVIGNLANDGCVVERVKNGLSGEFSDGGRIFDLQELGETLGRRVFCCHDLTDHKLQLENANRNSMLDELTGLPTRRFVLEHLTSVAADITKGTFEVAVIYIDLDNFKKYNDLYGHSFGDEILRVAARRFKGCIRAKDIVARMGGDEFVIAVHVHPGEDVRDVITHVTGRIFQSFGSKMLIDSVEADIHCSAGICEVTSGDNLTSAEMIRRADAAMFRAKQNGRSGYVFYTDEVPKNPGAHVISERPIEITNFSIQRSAIFKSNNGTLYEYTILVTANGAYLGLTEVGFEIISSHLERYKTLIEHDCNNENVNVIVVSNEQELSICEAAASSLGRFVYLAITDSLLEQYQARTTALKSLYRGVGVYLKPTYSITAVLALMGAASIVYVDCHDWAKTLDESNSEIIEALDQLSFSTNTLLIMDGLSEANRVSSATGSFFRRFTYDINR